MLTGIRRVGCHSSCRSGRFIASFSSLPFELPKRLTDAIEKKAVASTEQLTTLKKNASDVVVNSMTIQTTLSGMRGAQLLLCDTSEVHPIKGIAYRGVSLPKLMETLPRSAKSDTSNPYASCPTSEAVLWLLLTGSLPTISDVEVLRKELLKRSNVPEHCIAAIGSLPKDTHPMTQFAVGIAAAQTESVFSKAYQNGTMHRHDYWKYTLEDGLQLIGMLPGIASFIYNRRYCQFPGAAPWVPKASPSLDWAASLAQRFGLSSSPIVQDTMRLYMFLHADHESGNVSAHAAHLVGTALSDPFLAFTASMCGLAGPLHGLANQGCLRFLKRVQAHFAGLGSLKKNISDVEIRDFISSEILGRGEVVPGFGHAVLRSTDPRFTILEEYTAYVCGDNPDDELIRMCVRVVPDLLRATGKAASPWPNVDAHSGVMLHHVGLTQDDFFTVMFGLSRSLGVVSQLVWDRIFNLPIERPKSITLAGLMDVANAKKVK